MRRPLLLHAPRTAGRSLRLALGLMEPEIHVPIDEQRRRHDFTHRCVIAFTRDPYDRAVSLWTFMWARGAARRLTPDHFRSWMHEGMPHPSGREPLLYARRRYSIRVTAPQVDFIGTEHDFLGRYEQLPTDHAKLCSLLNRSGRLPHANRSARPWRLDELYDPATRERVAEVYRADFELFGSPLSGPTAAPRGGAEHPLPSRQNPGPSGGHGDGYRATIEFLHRDRREKVRSASGGEGCGGGT